MSARGVAAFGSDVSTKDPDYYIATSSKESSSSTYGSTIYSVTSDMVGRAIGLETALQFPAIDVVGGIDWNSINDYGVRDLMFGLRKRGGNEHGQSYVQLLGRHTLDHYDGDRYFNGYEIAVGLLLMPYENVFFDLRLSWSRTTDLIIEPDHTLEELKLHFGFGFAW